MTNQPDTAKSTTERFGDSDHRAELLTAMELAGATIARIPEDQIDPPAPCVGLDLDVAELVGHMTFVAKRLTAMYDGTEEAGDEWAPAVGSPSELAEAFQQATSRAQDRLENPALLDQTVCPWRPMTVRESLPSYVAEFTVHTWDLARATGLDVDFDDEVVAVAQAGMEAEVPAEHRAEIFAAVLPEGVEAPFAAATVAPEDASPADRLAAYVGREVS